MFGAAKPATGFGGFVAPAPTAGPAPAPTGGFGFSSTNTSTNMTTAAPTAAAAAAPGWGASAGSAAPAAVGGGWGVAKPATTAGWGFGAPQSQPPLQQPTTTTLGWGAAAPQQPAATGWGAPQPAQVQAQAQPSYTTLQNFTRQSALASFLMELDKAYDALSPNCRFRTFAYNACPPGHVMDAVQRERFIAFLHGGGVPVEEWMAALRRSPDPSRLYPQPLHFARELRQRCDKQRAELARLAEVAEGYLRDAEAVAASDEANKLRLRAMRQEDVMLRRRWYLLQRKLEVLRRLGARSGEEGLLLRQAEQLRELLGAPGVFRDALQSLQPLLDEEAELAAERQSVSRRSPSAGRPSAGVDGSVGGAGAAGGSQVGLLRAHVDAQVMEGWVTFAGQMQDGIQSLYDLLNRDKQDMTAIRERVTQ